MIKIQAKENKCIDLGRRGEDSARVIIFDIFGWAELYGQGEARLIAKRYKDLDSYPVEITQDNTTVSWVVKPVDNDQPGYGSCELVYVTNGAVVKSTIYQTLTGESLSDPVSPPNSPTTYIGLQRDIDSLRKELEETQEVVNNPIDPNKLPEGYPYEETQVTDISGQEYLIIGFDGNSSSQKTTVTHSLNIPFALGQVWKVRDGEYEIEVAEAEDDTLYIGNPDVNGIPFYITANEATINGNWQYMLDIRELDVICVSGEVSETTVHTIDEKFLPDNIGVQSDLSVTDENDPAYVKNQLTKDELTLCIDSETAIWNNNYAATNRFSTNVLKDFSVICAEIDGKRFPNVEYERSCYGDPDTSVWENGEGCGWQLKWNNINKYYSIRFDSSRFNATPKYKIYGQTVVKTIPPRYLPVATSSRNGVVHSGGLVGTTAKLYGYSFINDEGELFFQKQIIEHDIFSFDTLRNDVAGTEGIHIFASTGDAATADMALGNEAFPLTLVHVRTVWDNRPTWYYHISTADGRHFNVSLSTNFVWNSVKEVDHAEIKNINPKYIKDMYHEESSEVFSIENAEFVGGRYINETPFIITDGNTYVVNWDGTEYACAAYTFDGLPAIGNTSIMGGKGNGEPFAIAYNSVGNTNIIIIFDDSTTHTFSVVENVVHKVDAKYLPDGYPYVETTHFLNETGLENYAKTSPATFHAGVEYIVKVDGVEYKTTLREDYKPVAGFHTYLGTSDWSISDKSKYPFSIFTYGSIEDVAGTERIYSFCHHSGGKHDVEVYQRTTHLLSREYLPDGYPYEEDYDRDVEVLSETTLMFEPVPEDVEDNYAWSQELFSKELLQIGKVYNVVWDGQLYADLVCFESEGAPCLGLSYEELFSGSDKYPFLIYSFEENGFYVLGGGIPGRGGESHMLKIFYHESGTEYHPLAEKFLPSGYPYEREVTKVILPETGITIAEAEEDSSSAPMYEYSKSIGLEGGKRYSVTFDGTVYEVRGFQPFEGEPTLLGNTFMMGGPNSGEPFAIVDLSAIGQDITLFIADPGTHVVTIVERSTEIETIDPKFLPEGYPREELELVGSFTKNSSEARMTLYADAQYVVEVDGVKYDTELQTAYHGASGQRAFLGSAPWTVSSGATPPFSISVSIGAASLDPVDGVECDYWFWHNGADVVDVKVYCCVRTLIAPEFLPVAGEGPGVVKAEPIDSRSGNPVMVLPDGTLYSKAWIPVVAGKTSDTSSTIYRISDPVLPTVPEVGTLFVMIPDKDSRTNRPRVNINATYLPIRPMNADGDPVLNDMPYTNAIRAGVPLLLLRDEDCVRALNIVHIEGKYIGAARVATCGTEADVQEKAATISGGFTNYCTVSVKFSQANTAENPTLYLQSATSNYRAPICNRNYEPIAASDIGVGMYTFMYDSEKSCFILLY